MQKRVNEITEKNNEVYVNKYDSVFSTKLPWNFVVESTILNNGYNFTFLTLNSKIFKYFCLVFNMEYKLAYGFKKILKQFRYLIVKRFWIFRKRYMLATITLIFPLLMELVFAIIVPSQTNFDNQQDVLPEIKPSRTLNINDYGINQLAYSLNGSYSTLPIESLLENFYTAENRPSVRLLKVVTDNTSNFIFEKRKMDVKNLVRDFYIGMSFNVTSDSSFFATIYYSTMAFHSSALALNEITNLIFNFATNSYNKSITTINTPLSSGNNFIRNNDFLSNLACIDILPGSILNLIK